MEVLHSEEIETRINEGRFHRGNASSRGWWRESRWTAAVANLWTDNAWRILGEHNNLSGSKAGSLDAQFSDVARIGAACLTQSSAGAEGNGSVPDRLLFSASASVSIACTACTADKNVARTLAARALCRACWLHPPECLCDQILAAADAASDVTAPFQARFSVVCHPHEFMRSTSTAKPCKFWAQAGPNARRRWGAEQRCRLRALLEQKSASACPTFVLFPHAPTGADTISVRDGAASVPSPIAAFACKHHCSGRVLGVLSGHGECTSRAPDPKLNESTTLRALGQGSGGRIPSPLIESLKAGQGLGRISTLEAIALLLDEASGAAEAAVGAVAVRPVSSPLASVLIHRGLTPLVSYIKRKKTALSAAAAATRPRSIRKALRREWVDALRRAASACATKENDGALAGFSAPPLGARHCSLCGETLATPIRFAEHTRGRKHCDVVVRRMLSDPDARAEEGIPRPTEQRAREVYEKYSALPLSRLVPEPPDIALVHVLEGLHRPQGRRQQGGWSERDDFTCPCIGESSL